ncbi:carbohydrate ABC transporter permease [Ammoniphilus sp. YIM 78166]|uniref:carbohydrate ABC transporter permease n=1 Tax=Ammoniphilus sp. YIM 78166 TaxID=1644106 RepID=UPI0010700573|nr:carbohydrate ABC transporter permease [Ammoniphilus sp. YIM 78166]
MKSNHMNQFVVNGIFIVLVCLCVFPLALLFMTSITDDKAVILNGYSLFPSQFSLDAYKYLLYDYSAILRGYGITTFITVFGTFTGLLISSLLAYPLSRKDLPYRNFFAFLVFFTLLFNGGLVPTYLVYTEIFHIKNTIWALIVPNILTNGFLILLMRTYFMNSIPAELIESAKIDGASEFKIYYLIVLPLSLPILATIGLMLTITYWNDWFNGLIYVTNRELFSIQNMMYRMLVDIQFMNQDTSSHAAGELASMPAATVRMAMAVIGVFPLFCAYPFFQKYLVKGLTVGAVKG